MGSKKGIGCWGRDNEKLWVLDGLNWFGFVVKVRDGLDGDRCE